MLIGAAAARFGLAAHVLRHWEAMGLLSPARDGAGRRRYGRGDLFRIAAIVRAKEAGLGLADVGVIVARGPRAERRTILERRRAALTARIAAAEASLELIDGALHCPHEDLADCPKFERLVTALIDGGGAGESSC